jgi:hypothetical protein
MFELERWASCPKPRLGLFCLKGLLFLDGFHEEGRGVLQSFNDLCPRFPDGACLIVELIQQYRRIKVILVQKKLVGGMDKKMVGI